MNPQPPSSERIVGELDDPQLALPLGSDGVQRVLWRGRFGDMLLEAKDGRVFVNGKAVVPLAELRQAQDN